MIRPLLAEGYEVIAAQYGLDSLESDVAAVARTLGRVSSPAILVGHSYGGSVITAAGTDDRVAGLVYIAALAPDETETSQSQVDQFPMTDVFSYVEVADGRLWMRPEGVACFAGDLPDDEQQLVWATHFAPAADLFTTPVEGTAWRTKPSWYVVANNDRTVQPELERFAAKRMNATIYEVDSSHVPMLSNPALVLDVVRTAAREVWTRVERGRGQCLTRRLALRTRWAESPGAAGDQRRRHTLGDAGVDQHVDVGREAADQREPAPGENLPLQNVALEV